MTKSLALLALLPLLALPATARAGDSHYAREVEARFGTPATRVVVLCGGEAAEEQGRCLRWQYDFGASHAVFFFDSRTERLLEVFTWDDRSRETVDAGERVRSLLHAAQNAAEP